MATNLEVPLVARRVLGGPYLELTFRHAAVAHEARAGQFVMIKAGASADPPLRRPFSVLATDPAADTFSLLIKVVGGGTRGLAALAAGDVAQCLGPLGRPFTPPPEGVAAVLVAGGYGIAPFRLFGTHLRAAGATAHVFYGARTASDLPGREAFEALGIALVACTEDGSLGERGRVTGPVEAYLDARRGPVILYACGPDPMLHAVARLAEARRLSAEVSLDPWMGCGVGTCLGCVVRVQPASEARPRYRCACTEGPVFPSADVVWPGDVLSAARRRGEAGT